MRRSLLLVLTMLFIIPGVLAGTGIITIKANGSTGAIDTAVTGVNDTIHVNGWGGIKLFSVQSFNTSDTLTFNVANTTPGMIRSLSVNGVPINGYAGNTTGWTQYTYTQPKGVYQYSMQPVLSEQPHNTTWQAHQAITITSNYTITSDPDETIFINATSAAVNVTIPTAISNINIYHIKRIDNSANRVYVNTTSPGQAIDGYSNQSISGYGKLALQSNSLNWWSI